MRNFLIAFFLFVSSISAFAAPDWQYSQENVCFGAKTAKQQGLCANFTGATQTVCWGLKNGIANSCADMEPGAAQDICLGFREAHKKGWCNRMVGAGKDMCYAYASSISQQDACEHGTDKQKSMCQGLMTAWLDDSCGDY